MRSGLLSSAVCAALLAGCATSTGPGPRRPASPPAAGAAPAEVEAAIAAMKGIRPDRLSPPERSSKDSALDAAWKTLGAHPEVAARRLQEELAADESRPAPDDYFRMDAAALLWKLRGLEAAPSIARALEGIDLGIHMDVGFGMFARASATRDPRAWPVVRHALRLDPHSGRTAFPAHAMDVGWPLILEFIFAPYGPGLCATVAGEAAATSDPRVARSAAVIMSQNYCLEGLPVWRRWAGGGDRELAAQSLAALGRLAHPDDRERLVAATRSPEALIRKAAAYGLYEYGDPRAASALQALLADPAQDVRLEAIAGTFHLIDAEGARAIVAARGRAKTGSEEAALIDKMVDGLGKQTQTTPALLVAGNEREWARALAAYWKQRDAFFDLKPDDRRLSRDELKRALALWDKEGRISGGEFEWVDKRHVLAVALPDDLPAFRSVRGRIFLRQSDEALDEIEVWDRMIQVLHRRGVGAPKPNE